MAVDTIVSRLFEQGRKRPNDPAHYTRGSGGWEPTTWKEHVGEVRQATKALIALGVEPGDVVTILGFNRSEWVVVDLACMAAGGAPAGIYTTCAPEEVAYIINHSKSPLVLIEDEGQWKKIDEERENMPELKHVVLMKGVKVDDPLCMTWEEFLAKGDGIGDAKVDDRVAALEPDALATLIYTSGTTGPPKGVMLSHRNLAWTASLAISITQADENDCSLSYLPLSHIAEQMFSIHVPTTTGSQLYFAQAIDKVPDNLKEVQPTVFFGVPRIWEKFHAGISGKLKDATGLKKTLVNWSMGVATEVNAGRGEGREPGGWLGMKYGIANKLIFSKLKPAIGLGRARVCVSGAAPISREILEFFAALDVVVLEVYGQSEDTGPTSFNQPDRFRFGTVGPALAGVEVKIAEDDEILVKGPNVFLGYFKDEEATNATLKDGWLYSGDLGAFDKDGFLSITGRKKDIIITAGGKNITPKNIESSLKNHPLINEAVVIGDRRKFLSALVTIDPEAFEKFASDEGLNGEPAHEADQVRTQVQEAVDDTNSKFARVEQIKKFTILKRNLTIEDGELTPTLKVKRNKVNDHFADEIEAMYTE